MRKPKSDIKSKYTRERLAPLVASSYSVAEVIKKLDMKISGGTYGWIQHIIACYGLDRSHFRGKANNCGAGHVGSLDKLTWQQVLVVNRGDDRERTPILRRAMIESGILYKCNECGLDPLWRGQALTLQIEHKNGDCLDNRPENLCFLCPNCHSQTPTFSRPKNALCRTSPECKDQPRKTRVAATTSSKQHAYAAQAAARVALLRAAALDTSKFGWLTQAAQIIGIAPQNVRRFIEKQCPDLLVGAKLRG